jgi:hypothetical protein
LSSDFSSIPQTGVATFAALPFGDADGPAIAILTDAAQDVILLQDTPSPIQAGRLWVRSTFSQQRMVALLLPVTQRIRAAFVLPAGKAAVLHKADRSTTPEKAAAKVAGRVFIVGSPIADCTEDGRGFIGPATQHKRVPATPRTKQGNDCVKLSIWMVKQAQ